MRLRHYVFIYGAFAAYLAIVYLFTKFLWPYLWPLLFAFLLSQAVEPQVRWLERAIPRALAALLVLAANAGLLLFLLVYLLMRMSQEVAQGLRHAPLIYSFVTREIELFLNQYRSWQSGLPDFAQVLLIEAVDYAYQIFGGFGEGILDFFRNGLLITLPEMLGVLFFSVVTAYFISCDRGKIMRAVSLGLPPSWRNTAAKMHRGFHRNVFGFFKVQILLASATWVVVYFYLVWVLDSPYALLISIIVAGLDLTPVVGPALIFVPWILFSLWLGDNWLAFSLAAFFLALASVRFFVQMHWIGREMGIHPLAALLSVYFGIQFFGAAGLIIGPLAAVVWLGITPVLTLYPPEKPGI